MQRRDKFSQFIDQNPDELFMKNHFPRKDIVNQLAQVVIGPIHCMHVRHVFCDSMKKVVQAQIRLEDPKEGEAVEEIFWHNMKQSDILKNPQLFGCGAYAWLKANSTKNYQDLERELRVRGFETHLIAVPGCYPGIKYGLYQNGKYLEVEYCCIFSCRPTELATQELLSYWSSYEENFSNLPRAGNAFKNNLPKSGDTIYHTEPYNSISHNKKKLKIHF